LITLELASPAPISDLVADAVGSLVTQPAGGLMPTSPGNIFGYLSGGYEVVRPKEIKHWVGAFERLDVVLAAHPLAPNGAERLLYLFDSVDAQAAFRLPPATLEAPVGLETRHWREKPPPKNLPVRGLLIGTSVQRDTAQPVRVGCEDRLRHMYVVGQTGTGKTTLLQTAILDDIEAGEGICLIDPHGDLYKELLGKIPVERIDDVVILDPTDTAWPVGINILEFETETQRHFIIQEFIAIMSRIIEDEFGYGAVKEFAGPIFFQHMRMNLLLAMSNPNEPATLLEFYMIYQKRDYWRRWVPLGIKDPLLEQWVKEVLPKTDYLTPGSDKTSMGSYIGSKFEGFVFDPMLRNIFGQKRSTLNFREIMDGGKILLVNLAKGELTETNSRFLGMVLLAKLQASAMGRARLPEQGRRPFYVYVDEFQSIATQSFVTLLSEGRKFGLSLVLANQFVSQIKDARIVDSILGNVGTLICFRLGHSDAEAMEKKMFPHITMSDMVNVPNWHAYVATLVEGQAVAPFSIRTVLAPVPYDESRATEVRDVSRKKYGRAREEAEAEIAQSLAGQQ
jgi:hypothetical protein